MGDTIMTETVGDNYVTEEILLELETWSHQIINHATEDTLNGVFQKVQSEEKQRFISPCQIVVFFKYLNSGPQWKISTKTCYHHSESNQSNNNNGGCVLGNFEHNFQVTSVPDGDLLQLLAYLHQQDYRFIGWRFNHNDMVQPGDVDDLEPGEIRVGDTSAFDESLRIRLFTDEHIECDCYQ